MQNASRNIEIVESVEEKKKRKKRQGWIESNSKRWIMEIMGFKYPKVYPKKRRGEPAWSTAVASLPTHPSPQLWWLRSSRPLLALQLGGGRSLHVGHVHVIMPQQTVLMLEFSVAKDTLELGLLAALEPLMPLQRYHPPVLPSARVAGIRLETDG